jgi:Cu-Zn family superoxide dismutase
MKRLHIAMALATAAITGACGGDDGGDDAADTAADTSGTMTVTTDPTMTATDPMTMTSSDPTTMTDPTMTDPSVTVTDPTESSDGGSDDADSSSGDGGSSTTETAVTASATLESQSGSTAMGTVLFTDNGDGSVDLVIEASGVEPAGAQHGTHIHEFGDCSNNGDAAGMHWNPKGTTLGELGNIDIAADGTGTFMKTDAWSIGTGEVNDIVGKSVMIHADPDGGARIACGVIALD